MKKITRIAWIAAFAAVIASSSRSVAQAQDSADDERARLHFSAGRSYFEEGTYEEALQEFRRAYELSGREVLLVNIANTQERLGRWREAADTLEQFVATLPAHDQQRPILQRRIENLRARAAQHEAEERARSEREAPPTTTADAAPPEAPSALPPATATASDGLLVPSLVAFGVGAAGLITFATLGGLAMAEESAVASGCGATRSCTRLEVQAMDDLAIGADVSLAIGLVAGATGAVLLIVDPPRGASTESASARVLPFGHAEGGGISIQGSF